MKGKSALLAVLVFGVSFDTFASVTTTNNEPISCNQRIGAQVMVMKRANHWSSDEVRGDLYAVFPLLCDDQISDPPDPNVYDDLFNSSFSELTTRRGSELMCHDPLRLKIRVWTSGNWRNRELEAEVGHLFPVLCDTLPEPVPAGAVVTTDGESFDCTDTIRAKLTVKRGNSWRAREFEAPVFELVPMLCGDLWTDLPHCADGIDNDADGLTDLDDPGCTHALDDDEFNAEPTQCEDGVDNDGDGLVDLADPGCTNAQDDDESDEPMPPPAQCEDGVDNDGDGLVDMADPGCTSPMDDDETEYAFLPAFPGAEGYGALATGGRGGQVLKVVNLNASGEGSLQWALSQSGPRIVVFDVSGEIHGDFTIPHGDLTIAGQTSPGGIAILGSLSSPYGSVEENIIIRHLRVRGNTADGDGIQLSEDRRVILDHVDCSHSTDECIDFWGGATLISVQWSAMADTLGEMKALIFGPPRGSGPGGRISVHHNLFAHNKSRTPAMAQGPFELVNNVIYNAFEGIVHHNPAVGDFQVIGNYVKQGNNPRGDSLPYWLDPSNGPVARYWTEDHWMDDPWDPAQTGRIDNPWSNAMTQSGQWGWHCCGVNESQWRVERFNLDDVERVPVSIHTSQEAYEMVLNQAGAWPRDAVTAIAIQDVRDVTGSWQRPLPQDLGLQSIPSQPDRDGDGIPDAWETAHGLDPDNGADHSNEMPSGYTAIEQYINDLADALVGG